MQCVHDKGLSRPKGTDTPIWDRRRPVTLFSSLMKYGCCGGGYSKASKTHFGCSTTKNKGPEFCKNTKKISQVELERIVLHAMQNNLMDKEALAMFCDEYAKERNRLSAQADNSRDALTSELSTVTRDHGKLVDAIIAGIPADQVKERMNTLTERKAVLEAKLAKAPNADPIRIHPKMALTYRDKVTELINRLSDKDTMPEAKEALRALLERIVLVPSSKTDKLDVHIHGDLAGLLLLSMGTKRKNCLSTYTLAFDSIG